MNKFTDIRIEGYRRLFGVPLEMRELTVLIGANGVGKTSILDVFSLLAASAKGRLLERIGGSLESILTRGKADRLAFSLTMNVPDYAPLKYYLELVPLGGSSYQISQETLTQWNDLKAPQPLKYIDSRTLNVKYFNIQTHSLEPPSVVNQKFY